ncbi:HU family DNA-binding protein [uncultured Bacteroides sp.]|uniref:HU family DNA-binding protein n=1 Tax=uncultured Bacteroides sp. TaxID=162156 RepID=UPI002AAC3942|nr:HU family DNA-binding protein [uncultured Bacteroides sp.]
MPLFYKPLQSNVASKDGKKKWHPRLVKVGKVVDTQKIGELIADKASLTPGDVHNVIRNLMSVMREQLLSSRSVKLDGLGTFTMMANASGKGVDTPDEVSPSQIVNLRVQFTPTGTRAAGTGGTTRAMYTGVEYERWTEAADAESGDSGKTNGGNTGGNSEGEDPNA